ncbi:hypothetical protein Pan110_30220 [Gimesia panareensis]|nr:hypothetical protein Pan110_30220 [Gimesia panareensis]
MPKGDACQNKVVGISYSRLDYGSHSPSIILFQCDKTGKTIPADSVPLAVEPESLIQNRLAA